MADIDLARRAVACKGWRWMEGMKTSLGRRVYAVLDGSGYVLGVRCGDPRARPDCGGILHDSLPDLTDPATLGCLLALVREAWGIPTLAAVYCEEAHPGQGSGWAVQPADNRLPVAGEHDTEAAALVASLESAP